MVKEPSSPNTASSEEENFGSVQNKLSSLDSERDFPFTEAPPKMQRFLSSWMRAAYALDNPDYN
jgi:hypothetical protein